MTNQKHSRNFILKKATLFASAAVLTAALALPASAAPAPVDQASKIAASSTTAASSVENRLVKVAGFKSAANVRAYYANLQRAVAKGDKAGVAARVHYPLGVYGGDRTMVIKSKAQLMKNYDRIFTKDVKQTLAETKFDDLFVNQDGASVGQGAIWIVPSGSGMPGIMTVNLTAG
ncbi:hypothetical protein CDO73_01115 [Saccharibacillus sp. O23]|uniref:hypothetical protein n=1 Tax=Saccharibacillus sp. O23 TaxID=2009338 RepID=UPI000B4E05B1|nr:hypothetical protein [Saccharibacillus sp. O23]OWR33135.1 hypothetical protein CDO73_01115 [Saccharibacillus sp. O23]